MAKYYFSSESVSEGHPDKVSDQISDAVLDALLAVDPHAHVAAETLTTTNLAVLAGELNFDKSKLENATGSDKLDVDGITRSVIRKIGYTNPEIKFDDDSCVIKDNLHQQSADIDQGVSRKSPEEQGAGDQGIMFGYACDETKHLMPVSIDLAHAFLIELAAIRKEGKQMTYLRPDAKSQVTIEYGEDGKPSRIDTLVISTQHDEFVKGVSREEADKQMQAQIEKDVREILIPRVLKLDENYAKLFVNNDFKLFVNPTGRFVIGGPDGDTGLTGRKIIVDTYGGKGAHGGGAFSGKDPSKVDRSAAYAARHLAKNIVAAGLASEVLVQLAYAIGVAKPMNLYINTYGTSKLKISDGELAEQILNGKLFDFRPYFIEKNLGLRNPIYSETAAYGHVGRECQKVVKRIPLGNGVTITRDVELFTWEKTDKAEALRKQFLGE
ncbi:MAG: methionine adenosyltransferase [Paludibacteraceae bacterium]|nr:methionine adenosyltransferase [Paludibacteraceae bacterium]